MVLYLYGLLLLNGCNVSHGSTGKYIAWWAAGALFNQASGTPVVCDIQFQVRNP